MPPFAFDQSACCSRRTALRQGAAWVAGAAAIGAARPGPASAAATDADVTGGHGARVMPAGAVRPYRAAALDAERWLAACAQHSANQVRWPVDPRTPSGRDASLYSGAPGIVLFYLELAHATGDTAWRDVAAAGADAVMADLPADSAPLGEEGAGLYTGLAGVAVVLAMVHRATGAGRFADATRRVVARLEREATTVGTGAQWNPSNDIISGTAGIVLTLEWLAAAGAYGDPGRLRQLADAGGRRLVARALPAPVGRQWDIAPTIPQRYPNFSHGTAGVAYTLATLHRRSGDVDARRAALDGASHLASIATTMPGGGRKIYHATPGGESRYYLSWCHGPAGTARLQHRLATMTGDAAHRDEIRRLAGGIIESGVPEVHPDRSGFWNNVSQCCGSAGVAEFFLSWHAETREPASLQFATRVVDDLLARGTRDAAGLSWVQAEHRVRPELLVAQTGLMQGTAGMGLALLHLDGALEGRRPMVTLPDSPWTA